MAPTADSSSARRRARLRPPPHRRVKGGARALGAAEAAPSARSTRRPGVGRSPLQLPTKPGGRWMMRRFSLASQPGAPVDRAPVLHLCSNRLLPRSSYWRDQRHVLQLQPPSLPRKHRLPLLCTRRTPPLRALNPLPQAEVREAPPLLLCIRCSVAGSIQRLQAPKLRFITHTAPS